MYYISYVIVQSQFVTDDQMSSVGGLTLKWRSLKGKNWQGLLFLFLIFFVRLLSDLCLEKKN